MSIPALLNDDHSTKRSLTELLADYRYYHVALSLLTLDDINMDISQLMETGLKRRDDDILALLYWRAFYEDATLDRNQPSPERHCSKYINYLFSTLKGKINNKKSNRLIMVGYNQDPRNFIPALVVEMIKRWNSDDIICFVAILSKSGLKFKLDSLVDFMITNCRKLLIFIAFSGRIRQYFDDVEGVISRLKDLVIKIGAIEYMLLYNPNLAKSDFAGYEPNMKGYTFETIEAHINATRYITYRPNVSPAAQGIIKRYVDNKVSGFGAK